jgi:hypothetical protein
MSSSSSYHLIASRKQTGGSGKTAEKWKTIRHFERGPFPFQMIFDGKRNHIFALSVSNGW